MTHLTKCHLMAIGLVAIIITAMGCGASKTVERIETDTVVDLSGRWNDTDSRLVSEEIIMDCLNQPWITRHMTQSGGKLPVVIVGGFRNRSMEHIAVGTFVNDIERAFVNSGRVTVVASAQEREEIRGEKQDQEAFASIETIKEMGREKGADYMMTGEIQTIEDREGGSQITFYQTNVTLTSIETNEKIYLGQKKIKKYIERKGSGF